MVCNLTGHGLKQPEAVRMAEADLTPISPTITALRKQLNQAGS